MADGAKEILYIFNGDEENAEVEFDPDGAFPEPPSGSTIERNGKSWTVAKTSVQAVSAEPVGIPVLRINLTDKG
jgi:hypothetical protein